MSFSISAAIKKKFLTGLFVSIPAILTLLAIRWFFTFVDGLLEPFYFDMLGRHVPGLGFLSAIVLIFAIGVISSNVFGKKIISLSEALFLRLPVFNGFYTAIKQLVDAFSPDNNSASFKRVVIVEYPRAGSFAFGFLTKECIVKSGKTGELCLRAVYVPTNHLYLGDIILVNDKDVIYTDIPIDEGISIILSGGIAAPHMIRESGE